MSTTTHTPGPWTIAYLSCNSLKIIEGHHGLAVADMINPCTQSAALDMETTQANARLISAAPDMLEALEALLSASGDVTREAISARKAARALAYAAISKARGEG